MKPPGSKLGLGYDCKPVIEETEAINVAMDSEGIAKKLSQDLNLPVKQSLEAGNDSLARLEVCPIIIFWACTIVNWLNAIRLSYNVILSN